MVIVNNFFLCFSIHTARLLFHIRASLFLCEIFIYHIFDTDIQQLIHVMIGIRSVGITPLAVVLV